MNLERAARKCLQMIANRYRTAEAFVRMRKEIYDLKAQVRELSKSNLLAEMHWMKSELSAYHDLKGRLGALKAENQKWEGEIAAKQEDFAAHVRQAAAKRTQFLDNRIDSLKVEVAQANAKAASLQAYSNERAREILDLRAQIETAESEHTQLLMGHKTLRSGHKRTLSKHKYLALQCMMQVSDLINQKPVWALGFNATLPPAEDPIYRLRLQ